MGISMRNNPKNQYPQKTLSDGPSANLKQLLNLNISKVLIVKWSHKLNFVTKSFVSDIPKIVRNYNFFHNLCIPENLNSDNTLQ